MSLTDSARTRRFGAVAALIVVNVSVWWWTRARQEPAASAQPGGELVDHGPLDQPAAGTTEFLGVILTGDSVSIEAKVEGRIESVYVKAGDHVQKDSRIAQLDKGVREQELRSARAAFKDATRRFARRAVLARGAEAAISVEELDAARTQLALERGRLAALEASVAETMLVAPTEGDIAEIYLPAGALTGPGRPVARLITRSDQLRVRFAVPEDQARSLVDGSEVDVRVPSVSFETRGKMMGINPEVDAATRMVYAVAALPVPASDARLITGLLARVRPRSGLTAAGLGRQEGRAQSPETSAPLAGGVRLVPDARLPSATPRTAPAGWGRQRRAPHLVRAHVDRRDGRGIHGSDDSAEILSR